MLAKNIKALRIRLGYTQAQIAQYLGISTAAVTQYETEAREIPVSVVSKLAILFNIDEYELYRETPQQQQILSAFAFRAEQLDDRDIESIAAFRKIVFNYFHLSNAIRND